MVMIFDDHMYKAYWQKWKNFREIQGKNQRGRSDVNTAYSVLLHKSKTTPIINPHFWVQDASEDMSPDASEDMSPDASEDASPDAGEDASPDS